MALPRFRGRPARSRFNGRRSMVKAGRSRNIFRPRARIRASAVRTRSRGPRRGLR